MKKLFFTFVALLLSSGVFILSQNTEAEALSGSGWIAGRIIDDSVFTNSKDMSASQIQSFLDAKVGTNGYDSVPGKCDNKGERNAAPFNSNITRKQYAANKGLENHTFTCLNQYYEVPKTSPSLGTPYNNYGNQPGDPNPPGSKSAAQIIYDAAQKYKISPRVLLIMLQKESAGPLVTDDWPFENQYTYAMGARCPDGPDGAECDPEYAGFSMQMYEAASLFRWYLDSMDKDWWPYAKPGNRNVLWNVTYARYWNGSDWVACGGKTINIETKATAALYTYTPYQPNAAALEHLYTAVPSGDGFDSRCAAYGNRNFWRMFHDWFGSTQGTPFFRLGSNASVYILGSEDNYYHVASMDVLESYGYGKNIHEVETKSSSFINGLTYSGKLTHVAKFESAPIYLIDAGGRHYFKSKSLVVDTFGYTWPDETSDGDISYLRQLDEQYFPSSPSMKTILKERGGKPVYSMENGNKRHIVDRDAFNSGEPAYSSRSNMELSKYYLSTLPQGSSILAPGYLYRIGSTATVYLVNVSDKSLRIPTKVLFNQFGFLSSDVRMTSSSRVEAYQPESGLLDYFVKKPSGQIWLIHSGNLRAYVSGEMAGASKYDLDSSALPVLTNELVTSYKAGGVHLTDLIQASGNPKVYLIENGQKRWITSMATFEDHGGHDNLTEVSQSFVDSLPSGANKN